MNALTSKRAWNDKVTETDNGKITLFVDMAFCQPKKIQKVLYLPLSLMQQL